MSDCKGHKFQLAQTLLMVKILCKPYLLQKVGDMG